MFDCRECGNPVFDHKPGCSHATPKPRKTCDHCRNTAQYGKDLCSPCEAIETHGSEVEALKAKLDGSLQAMREDEEAGRHVGFMESTIEAISAIRDLIAKVDI